MEKHRWSIFLGGVFMSIKKKSDPGQNMDG
jgi:hypothetical protein